MMGFMRDIYVFFFHQIAFTCLGQGQSKIKRSVRAAPVGFIDPDYGGIAVFSLLDCLNDRACLA
jgi:hypothetical protein